LSKTTSLDTSWMARGACLRHDPETFFPDLNGGSPEQAKKICRHCPVQGLCLGYALRTRQRYGVWGGMTTRQRARYLTRKSKAA
jgi:WhiB family transcriptional regulator, redox-sensing transcriptional regulator